MSKKYAPSTGGPRKLQTARYWLRKGRCFRADVRALEHRGRWASANRAARNNSNAKPLAWKVTLNQQPSALNIPTCHPSSTKSCARLAGRLILPPAHSWSRASAMISARCECMPTRARRHPRSWFMRWHTRSVRILFSDEIFTRRPHIKAASCLDTNWLTLSSSGVRRMAHRIPRLVGFLNLLRKLPDARSPTDNRFQLIFRLRRRPGATGRNSDGVRRPGTGAVNAADERATEAGFVSGPRGGC